MPPPCNEQNDEREVLGLLQPNSRHFVLNGAVGMYICWLLATLFALVSAPLHYAISITSIRFRHCPYASLRSLYTVLLIKSCIVSIWFCNSLSSPTMPRLATTYADRLRK